jgi:hypothetical protein
MIFPRRSNIGFAPILGIVVNVRDLRALMLFRMATIAGFFLANQFFDQTFRTKEFRAVERGAGYRTEVEF